MKKVPCPECGEDTVYSLENPYRPFCSERCKLIDLGEWASEGRKLPSQEPITEEDLIDHMNDDMGGDDFDPDESMKSPWLH